MQRDNARERWVLTTLLSLLATFAMLCLLHVLWRSGFDADEVEHLHVAWLLGHGELPYRDFHQLHTPLLWILAAPLTRLLTPSLAMMISLRAVSVAVFASALGASAYALRRCVPHAPSALGLAILCAAAAIWAVPTEAYRFRPDPFMAAAAMAGVAVLTGHWKTPVWRPFAAGVLLGLAACFSPKIAPMVLVVPFAVGLRSIEQHELDWRGALSGLTGGVLAPLAMLGWLSAHGLVRAFERSVLADNARIMNHGSPRQALGLLLVYLALCVGMLWRLRARPAEAAWRPLAVVSLAALLGLTIPLLETNHFTYNYQAALLPAAVVASVAASLWMAPPKGSAWRGLALLAAVGVLSVGPLWNAAGQTNVHGITISQGAFDTLTRCAARTPGTCAGFAPFHPVACRDASELYLWWDYRLLVVPWAGSQTQAAYRAMWHAAGPQIERSAPDWVLGLKYWRWAEESGAVRSNELGALSSYLHHHYTAYRLDGVEVWARNDVASCFPKGSIVSSATFPPP